MPRININQLNLNSDDSIPEDYKVSEKGPWSAEVWVDEAGTKKVVLQSNDFEHDVALYVSGDFCDIDHKLLYAELLADRMNRMPEE